MLAPGTLLGHVELLAHIGHGGMGDVYKARDTRLNRIVAIKTSQARFNERFTREARAIAALNHPNIATLYDVGPDYLVMEFVDGEPVKGPLAHAEALAVAKQIVDAIEAAHDKAIIHRDLKPGNILRREDGTVKVLDFGLAKALENDEVTTLPPGPDSPTLTMEATKVGMILGTAAYMSPEQAKGKRADRRADIFSFGVVLYELLTGKRLFTGESTGEVLASVIKEESKLDAVPENWRGLLERCLTKDPRQRLQSIGEARILLEKGMPAVERLSAPLPSRFSAVGLVGWAVAALALAGVAYLYSRPAAEAAEIRFEFMPPDNGLIMQGATISPDGKHVAFFSKNLLWVRDLNSAEARAFPGTEGAQQYFWSPDSAFIGFQASRKLQRVPVAGGVPQVVIARDGVGGWGAAWSTTRSLVVSHREGLLRSTSDGGEIKVLYKNPDATTQNGFPSFLPDGLHFLFAVSSDTTDRQGIYLGSLDGDTPLKLLPDYSAAYFHQPGAATGQLLFRRDNALMMQPFDPVTLKLSSVASVVAERVSNAFNIGSAGFSASDVGSIAFHQIAESESQLFWFDRSGRKGSALGGPAPINQAIISKDESKLALVLIDRQTGTQDVWVQDASRGTRSKLTSLANIQIGLAGFSPDGSHVLFSARTGAASRDLLRRAVSGRGKEELVLHGGPNAAPNDWAPDGKTIVYLQSDGATGRNLYLLPMEGEHKPVVFANANGDQRDARFSPDGRWIAYDSNESGRYEVYVQAISGGQRVQVSVDGGTLPEWRRDGKELYFQGAQSKRMASATRPGATFEASVPTELFPLPPNQSAPFIPSANGQKFLIGETVTQNAPSPSTVILNWKPQ